MPEKTHEKVGTIVSKLFELAKVKVDETKKNFNSLLDDIDDSLDEELKKSKKSGKKEGKEDK